MAEHKLAGDLVLLLIDPAGGTSYDTVVCGTGLSITGEANIIDATSKCGSDVIAGIPPPATIEFEGQQLFDPASGKISGADIFDLFQNQTIIGWKVAPDTPATGDPIKSGKAIISSLGEDYALGSPSTFSITLTVKGDITQTITV